MNVDIYFFIGSIFTCLLGINTVYSYCGNPLACECLNDIIVCQSSGLNQIPYFTPLDRKNVERLNMKDNDIVHPRGDIFKRDWPKLQTIDLRGNEVDCSSNYTLLNQRFICITDNCPGKYNIIKEGEKMN